MRHRILLGLFVMAAMFLMTARPAQAADDDTQAVKAAVAKFHDALNTLFTGDATPIKAVWSHADDVDLHVTASPTLAVVHYYEKGENVIDGKPQPVNIRTTTTFRKEGSQWKVFSHHTDTLAYLQK